MSVQINKENGKEIKVGEAVAKVVAIFNGKNISKVLLSI